MVAVDSDESRMDRAIGIMNDHGVIDIDQHAAKHGYGGEALAGTATGAAIPVVQEDLQVGKRTVQRGGVRVYSRVIKQPVEKEIKLREEKVTVERHPVNRPLTDADRAGLRDQSIEVTEMAEEAVIQKQARVVEEVRIGKESTERTQTVRDTVRRTEVETENIGTGQGNKAQTGQASNNEAEFRKDFQTRYGSSGATYETYAPAYDYGYRMAGDKRYKGNSWSDVEPTLKTDYLRQNPKSTWDQAKGAVQYGWEKVTGQR